MALSAALLDLLVCPDTKQPLQLADAALLSRLNDRITAGNLTTVRGKPFRDPLTAALVREDGVVAYGVVDDIPVMLVDEGISLAQLG